MERFTRLMHSIRHVFLQVTETGLVLVGFIVLVYLLLGEESGAYVISVVSNLTILVGAIGPNALIGIAIVLALVVLLRRKGGMGGSG